MTPAWTLVTSKSTQKKAWRRTAFMVGRHQQHNTLVDITCNPKRPLTYFEDPDHKHLFDKSGSIPPNLGLTGLQYLIYFLDHPDEHTASQADFNLGYFLDPQRGLSILNRLAASSQEWRHLAPMIDDFISNKTRRARILISQQITLKAWSDYLELYTRALHKGYKRQKKHTGEFLCLDHFTRFREYLKFSTHFGRHGDRFYYLGCRKCESTINSVRTKKVVAVLDSEMNEPLTLKQEALRVNWLVHQAPFDFNTLEIGPCSEDEITKFCIDIGNDSDTYRTPRYSSVKVKVKNGVQLSNHSKAQLGRFFRL